MIYMIAPAINVAIIIAMMMYVFIVAVLYSRHNCNNSDIAKSSKGLIRLNSSLTKIGKKGTYLDPILLGFILRLFQKRC